MFMWLFFWKLRGFWIFFISFLVRIFFCLFFSLEKKFRLLCRLLLFRLFRLMFCWLLFVLGYSFVFLKFKNFLGGVGYICVGKGLNVIENVFFWIGFIKLSFCVKWLFCVVLVVFFLLLFVVEVMGVIEG